MNQHYLPRCYLKSFTKDGKLYVLDYSLYKEGRNVRPKERTPASICYEYDIYTLDFDSPYQKNAIASIKNEYFIEQDIFGAYENLYPQILSQIIGQNIISHKEARFFLRTLISLKLRNKYWQNVQNEQHVGVVQNVIGDFRVNFKHERHKFPNVSEEIANNLIDKVENVALHDPRFKRTAQLVGLIERELKKNSIVDDVISKLIFYKWQIFFSPQGNPFLTTDNPGFCVDHEENIYNTRFIDGVFIFPLTPNHCLLISDEYPDVDFYDDSSNKILHRKSASNDFVQMINAANLEHLNKIVISRDMETITIESLNQLPKSTLRRV